MADRFVGVKESRFLAQKPCFGMTNEEEVFNCTITDANERREDFVQRSERFHESRKTAKS